MSFETGFFLGTDPSVLSSVSTWLGKPVDVMNWQLDRSSWSAWLNSLTWSETRLAGVTTQINYTVPLITTGSSLATAAAHGYDSYYVQAAKDLLAISGGQDKIVVRVGEEFNGNWMPWAAQGQEANFAQAYRNFVDAFRTVSDKFVFEWNVAVGQSGANVAAAYPGDNYVDIVSGDLYWDSTQSWSVKDPTKAFNYYSTTTNGLNWLANFAAAHGKGVALSEWGVNSDNAGTFIQDVYNWLTTHNAVYESYWNSTSSFNGMLSNGQYPDAAAEFLTLFGGSGAVSSTVAVASQAAAVSTATASQVAATSTVGATAVSDSISSSAAIDYHDLVGTGLTDTFSGTTADFNGGSVANFGFGDQIHFTDVTASALSYVRVGDVVTLVGGESFTLDGAVGRLVTTSATDGTALLGLASHEAGLSDFDGNGHSDLLWRNDAGTFATWQVSGNTAGNEFAYNSVYDVSVPSGWKIQETLDFDGDGRSDILWHNPTTGALSIWTGAPGHFTPNAYYDGSVSPDWSIAGVGDLNGDGKDDIVWRQSSGAFATWQSTGTGFTKNVYFDASVGTDWQIVGLGDFNGDGKADLLWRNQKTGAFSEWQSTGAGFTKNVYYDGSVNTGWHIDAIADFNGDGKDDLLWRHDGDGAIAIWQSTGSGFTTNTYVNNSVSPVWQVEATGDFNDDGKADIVWRNTVNGSTAIWQSNGNGFDVNTAYFSSVDNSWHIQGHDYNFG